MNRLLLWKQRTQLDKDYNQIIESYFSSESKKKESTQTTIAMKCNFCSCKNDHHTLV